jgi:hypothetical protein
MSFLWTFSGAPVARHAEVFDRGRIGGYSPDTVDDFAHPGRDRGQRISFQIGPDGADGFHNTGSGSVIVSRLSRVRPAREGVELAARGPSGIG